MHQDAAGSTTFEPSDEALPFVLWNHHTSPAGYPLPEQCSTGGCQIVPENKPFWGQSEPSPWAYPNTSDSWASWPSAYRSAERELLLSNTKCRVLAKAGREANQPQAPPNESLNHLISLDTTSEMGLEQGAADIERRAHRPPRGPKRSRSRVEVRAYLLNAKNKSQPHTQGRWTRNKQPTIRL